MTLGLKSNRPASPPKKLMPARKESTLSSDVAQPQPAGQKLKLKDNIQIEVESSGDICSTMIIDSNESGESYQIDGGTTAWLVVFGCFLLYFNMLGGTYSFGVYEAHYSLHEFPGQASKIALIGSTSSGVALATGVLAGRWVELYGERAVVIAGSIIFSGSLAAAGFCKSLPALILTQGILSGVGVGILTVPGITAMIPWFPNKASLVLGLASSGAGLGGIFWSFITRIIISNLSYQWALWVMALVSAFLYAVAVILIKPTPGWKRPKPIEQRRSYREILIIFKDYKFVSLYISNVISLFGYLIPFFYVPTYAQEQLNSPVFVGAVLAAIMNLGISVGRIILGFWANSSVGAINTIVVSMAIASLCQLCLWLPASNSIVLLYIFAFVYGFFGGGYIGLVPIILPQIFEPSKIPSITGLFLSSDLPGAMAGTPIAGAIFSKSHDQWFPVILFSSLAMMLGTLITLITRFQVEKRVFATV